MAFFRDKDIVKQVGVSDLYDKIYSPGETATYSGIYKCTGCGKEISHNAGVALPSQNHTQHPYGPVRWKMIVFAETNG
jgi:hypothetical protein